MTTRPIQLRLNAVIIAVVDDSPQVLTLASSASALAALPAGPLDDARDQTLELALRRLVREQTGLDLAYVEQLYTFGDHGRDPKERALSVAYLALVRPCELPPGLSWTDVYDFFPWEDWRDGPPPLLREQVEPVLRNWVDGRPDRQERADITFGLEGSARNGARVLERYELLYELSLVAERYCDLGKMAPEGLGRPMSRDHRRMVSTAIGRIRGKLSYRPVVFELLPATFTLSRLQRVVEALAGVGLHTPNFRRLVVKGGLVEGTGQMETRTGGRPAELFRFRREVLRERPGPGVGLPGAR